MLERMFIPQQDAEGKPLKAKFDKFAWARNVLRREHSDPAMLHIARGFLKEAQEPAPEPEKGDPYKRYKKLVVEEFWNQHGLEVSNQLDQRFSDEPNLRRPIIPPATAPSSDRQFARFLVTGEVLDAAGLVAQRLMREPYGPMGIDLLSDGYWTKLEERVRSTLHSQIIVYATRRVEEKPPPPARELAATEVDALLPVAPETAPVQNGTAADDEDARLRALFE